MSDPSHGRRVQLLRREPTGQGGRTRLVSEGEGTFHAWGLDYVELDSGIGTVSVAIVELDDGTVRTWAADDALRFLDRETEPDQQSELRLLVGALITVARMPNAEHEADAHNRAVTRLRELYALEG
ncbi:hypothetical protein CKO31_24135 [Thiohalocapsa halophila]|uniref:Uncharacterized protein n=1 Tax=Thiohalocapsa halophila TaxID=69359 RepID=A0ABS1CPC7_9GAMM|nr:hypothetical protein [Thiohalocapsa halophila]MBK1633771.1 hypothetical protein [Thiohalocapsa halophila]